MKLKSCPQCKRTYADEALDFCVEDGAPLSVTDEAEEADAALEPSETEPVVPLKGGSFWRSEKTIQVSLLLLGAAVIGLIFRKLQYATQGVCCGDYDGYYHIRWSRLLWEGMRSGHFPPTFKWLPLTTLNPQDYVDHHLFFHFLQIPFTWFGDIRAGAKAASWLYSTLAVLSCYWLVVRYRIRHTLIWLVALLACSAPFIYRMNMAKAPPVAIIFMVIGIYLLFERRYFVLLPLAFLFVWTYSLFVTLVAAAVIWTCVIGWTERRFEWRPIVWTFAGTVAGFVINPYFPKNVRLFIEHVLIKFTPGGFTTEVGNEWYPYDSWFLLGGCVVAFVAMFVGFAAYDWADRKRAERPLFLMFFSTILMIATFRSRRWAEYWPPFAVLFAAFSLKPLLEGARAWVGRLPGEMMEELKPFLDRHEPPGQVEGARRRAILKELEIAGIGIALGLIGYFVLKQIFFKPPELPLNRVLLSLRFTVPLLAAVVGFGAYVFWRRNLLKAFAVAVVACLVIVLNANVRVERMEIAGDFPPDHYEATMAWIRENVKPDVKGNYIIFSLDWDEFPKMFYLDTSHAYASGLDPTYLLDRDQQLKRDPSLADLYKKITTGEDVSVGGEREYGPLIRDHFNARYVFYDNEHDNFYGKAMDSGWFEEIHIYTVERRDGLPLTREDLAAIEQKSTELKNWVMISDGRRVVSGSTKDLVCKDVNGLCDSFEVKKDQDSSVLHILDQKGQPPPEAQEELDGESGQGDEDVDDEPGNP